jgi:hypothetical protein
MDELRGAELSESKLLSRGTAQAAQDSGALSAFVRAFRNEIDGPLAKSRETPAGSLAECEVLLRSAHPVPRQHLE